MNKCLRLITAFILFLVTSSFSILQAQYVPTHITNEGIYLFLDELATANLIDLNSLVKPWSRNYIAEKLAGADSLRHRLTPRQQSELDFYLRDYAKACITEPGTGNQEPETENQKPETGNREPGTGNRELGTGNREPSTFWFWQKKGTNKRFDAFCYSDTLS